MTSTSTSPDACSICGEADCKGTVYPHMVREYRAGRNREHWRRIHDLGRYAGPVVQTSPEDLALRAYVARRKCCG
jgi:hypothetical protein